MGQIRFDGKATAAHSIAWIRKYVRGGVPNSNRRPSCVTNYAGSFEPYPCPPKFETSPESSVIDLSGRYFMVEAAREGQLVEDET